MDQLVDYLWDVYEYKQLIPFYIDTKEALKFWLQLQLLTNSDELISNYLTILRKYHDDVQYNIHTFRSMFILIESLTGNDIVSYNTENDTFKIGNDFTGSEYVQRSRLLDYLLETYQHEDGGELLLDIAFILAQINDIEKLNKVLEIFHVDHEAYSEVLLSLIHI